VRGGYLRQAQEEYNALKVTERGLAVLFQGEQVTVAAHTPSGVPRDGTSQAHPELFERLRALRKRLADDRGIPPYVIFHDSTLRQMAAALPTSPEALLRISGVGRRKAQEYGEVFLAEIAAFVAETGAEATVPLEPALARRRSEPGATVRQTVRLFREGYDVEEIAARRTLARSTVEGHLAEAMESGEEVDVARLIDAERRRKIEAAVAACGTQRLGPLMEYLGDGYTYGELRLVCAALRRASEWPA
jgi:ATP-dependent DNA helicase RecQ